LKDLVVLLRPVIYLPGDYVCRKDDIGKEMFILQSGITFITSAYSVLQQFRQAKFAYGGSILSLSQFLLLPQLPQKMKLTSNVVKKLTQNNRLANNDLNP
jgi:hypothetical protein